MEEGLVDIPFVKEYTDMPLLVRTDNLIRLHPDDFIPGYKNQQLPKDGFTTKWMANFKCDMMSDFVVWDTNTNKPVVINREDIGAKMLKRTSILLLMVCMTLNS
jgi:nitrate reductase alpha subunit